jgi:hypothetical protein
MIRNDDEIATRLREALAGAIEQVPSGTLQILRRTRVGNHFPAMQSANDAVFSSGGEATPDEIDKGPSTGPLCAESPAKFVQSADLRRGDLHCTQSANYSLRA